VDLLLEANEDRFDRAINGLIADGDDRALLDLLGSLPTTVERLRGDADERFDVPIPIVNACATAAVALRRNKAGAVGAALDALLATYRLGPVASDGGTEDDLRLWEESAGALWALGAVAVQMEAWDTVRSIVAREPEPGGHYRTWLRHGQVMSARGAIDRADDNVLNLCIRRLATNRSFGFVGASVTEREQSVCAFDALAHLVVMSLPGGGLMDFYPSYAKFPVEYVEAAVIALRREGGMRSAVFPEGDVELRNALRDMNEMALYQAAQSRYHGGSWAYVGFQDARTWSYLREGHFYEQWPTGIHRA
jgi:hypothetical protein